MIFRKYLSSLRSTYIFMVCFGVLIGAIFPFYSWLFFGPSAFAPLYAFGCVTAGFIVGTFCYYIIKEALKLYVERQWLALCKITGKEAAKAALGDGDELQQLIECNDTLMNRVFVMVENISRLTSDISSRHDRLTSEFGKTVSGNEKQLDKEKETLKAVDDMNVFFNDLLKEIEDIAARTDERASISTELSATIAAMLEIEKKRDCSVDAIKRLSLHALRVGEFLKVIKDVVAQTNLLSLNASIIAAQAGERGKSFAVVAEGGRALAQRTSASTSEIEELVKNIQEETTAAETAVTQGKEKVAEGVRISGRADEALHRIEESAAEASQMVQKIAAATDEQASGSRLITDEAEKNMSRAKQFTRAIQEEEKGAALIVKSLEHMRGLSQKITTSTEEQARGNRLYMKSVLEDNEKVKELRETCIQQIMMGDVLRNDVTEVDCLIEANATEAKRIMTEIEIINDLIGTIQQELATFRQLPPKP